MDYRHPLFPMSRRNRVAAVRVRVSSSSSNAIHAMQWIPSHCNTMQCNTMQCTMGHSLRWTFFVPVLFPRNRASTCGSCRCLPSSPPSGGCSEPASSGSASGWPCLEPNILRERNVVLQRQVLSKRIPNWVRAIEREITHGILRKRTHDIVIKTTPTVVRIHTPERYRENLMNYRWCCRPSYY